MAFENNAMGIDVSLWQRDLDWAALKKAGVSFAFAKATEADNITDPYFAKNWPAIKTAGIVRGAYHFFRPAKDAVKQAGFFVQTVKPEQGDLPLALDLENSGGLAPVPLVKAILTCLNEIERLSGVRPIVYTGPNFWNTSVAVPSAPDWTGNYPLWIANYTSAPKPTVPKGWTTWTIWQYTDQGRLAGYSSNLDFDRYNGTLDDLLAWVGAAVQPVTLVDIQTLVTNYLQALNARDFDGLAAFYSPTGARSSAAGTVQGPEAIRAWYVDWLSNQFAGGSFTLNAIDQINDTTWSFTWECHSPKGTQKGQDTVGLQDSQLHYHTTNLM